jgi:hypothetical protein
MNLNRIKLIMCLACLLGVALWIGMAQKFDSEDRLSYNPNVACVKGSPYGKVFALAMQGPIDFYWHDGKSHEHAELLADDHEHHNDHDHNHDHGHEHDQVHQFDHVYDYDDGHGNDERCFESIAERDVVAPSNVVEVNIPVVEKAQLVIKQMEANTHRKTNDEPLSIVHRQHLQGEIEDKLRFAYELDPTNYTNYGNYHLFLYTSSFGRATADEEAALSLARHTYSLCMLDTMDPASSVTAASAAYNIISHIGRHHSNYSISEAKQSLENFDHCIDQYFNILSAALLEGRVIPQSRLAEMKERVSYLSKLRKAQGVYMKRIMSNEMAANRS